VVSVDDVDTTGDAAMTADAGLVGADGTVAAEVVKALVIAGVAAAP
jgi:hypothetical protein